jgi:hypothetical protein
MAGGKNREFMADPIAFMKKHSCFPTDIIESEQGRAYKQMNVTVSGAAAQYPLQEMGSAFKVGYLGFSKRPRGSAFNFQAPACADEVMGVYGTYTPTAGRVKSYFLPWIQGGIMKIEIPAKGTVVVNDDVKYFFTAGLTGCSIFIRGTPQAPIVYHAGGETGSGNDVAAGAKFWRDLIERHEGGAYREVNKTEYNSGVGLGQMKSVHSVAYENWLKANTPTDLNISMTSPFGCVMGVRADNGDWTFYLQQNATVIYTKMKKAHFYSQDRKVTSTTRGVARPMVFTRFFPQGPANVVFNPSAVRAI